MACNGSGTCGVLHMSMQSDREIYAEVSADLVRFASILVGPDRAPDVVSTVVTRALGSGPLSRLTDARSYLMRSVLNESRNVIRKQARGEIAAIRSEHARVGRDVAEGRYPDLAAAVLALPDRQRAAMYLTYWCDMTATEVGQILGCRPATVRRYLSLARAKLEGYKYG